MDPSNYGFTCECLTEPNLSLSLFIQMYIYIYIFIYVCIIIPNCQTDTQPLDRRPTTRQTGADQLYRPSCHTWTMVHRPWSMNHVPWTMFKGLDGPWAMVHGQWSMVHSPWPMVRGQWTMDTWSLDLYELEQSSDRIGTASTPTSPGSITSSPTAKSSRKQWARTRH